MSNLPKLFIVIGVGSALGASLLAADAQTALPCAKTTIASKTLPTGPAQYQSGSLRLSNGASLRLTGSAAELYRARQLQPGDPVAACYGPLTRYADAGPSRTITVLDLKNGAYYGALVGNWKPR